MTWLVAVATGVAGLLFGFWAGNYFHHDFMLLLWRLSPFETGPHLDDDD